MNDRSIFALFHNYSDFLGNIICLCAIPGLISNHPIFYLNPSSRRAIIELGTFPFIILVGSQICSEFILR